MPEKLMVFVCTGNVCRSPMAEHLLRKRLGEGSQWEVCSAGLAAGWGQRASRSAVRVMEEQGIDIGSHVSRPLDRELVDAASIIVVMTAAHRQQVLSLFPDAEEKVFLLRSFDDDTTDKDIEDPMGLSVDTYGRIHREIDKALPGLIEFMNTLEI